MGGSSMHWLDWDAAFPRFTALLSPRGVVAIVHRRLVQPPWQEELQALRRRGAPGDAQDRPDLVAELERRGLFRETGRREVGPVSFAQWVADYVASLHSYSSLSLDRMPPAEAAAFDQQVSALVRPWSGDGVLQLETMGSVVWGKPQARSG
jgi:hypothetical protein